jgi:N utilization substance protein B
VSEPRPVARRHSRRLALQVLYAADLALQNAGESGEVDYDRTFDDVATHFDLPSGARDFAKELVAGVSAAREVIDSRVALHARNWRVERMAMVDRNVLRLAVHELVQGQVPHSVVINEAIELARDFGSERSPAFVNGVLDAVARDLTGVDGPSEET